MVKSSIFIFLKLNIRLKKLNDHEVPIRLVDSLFNGNLYEVRMLREYQAVNNLTTQNIRDNMFEDFVDNPDGFKQLNNINGGIEVNDSVIMKRDSPICGTCWKLVWYQLCFIFRMDIKSDMKDEVKDRQNCWYGINCRTMTHNDRHAKNLNHIIPQSITENN